MNHEMEFTREGDFIVIKTPCNTAATIVKLEFLLQALQGIGFDVVVPNRKCNLWDVKLNVMKPDGTYLDMDFDGIEAANYTSAVKQAILNLPDDVELVNVKVEDAKKQFELTDDILWHIVGAPQQSRVVDGTPIRVSALPRFEQGSRSVAEFADEVAKAAINLKPPTDKTPKADIVEDLQDPFAEEKPNDPGTPVALVTENEESAAHEAGIVSPAEARKKACQELGEDCRFCAQKKPSTCDGQYRAESDPFQDPIQDGSEVF